MTLVMRDYGRAESFYKQAIEIVPHEWFSYVNVANAQVGLGKFSEARGWLAVSRTKVKPPVGLADLVEARVLYNMGKIDSSIVLAQRALPLELSKSAQGPDLFNINRLRGRVRASVAGVASWRADNAQRGRIPPRLQIVCLRLTSQSRISTSRPKRYAGLTLHSSWRHSRRCHHLSESTRGLQHFMQKRAELTELSQRWRSTIA
jgi:hypothetical protein